MNKIAATLPFRLLAALVLATLGRAAETTQRPRHPAPEDTYTITATLQILNPVNPDDMTDDFQDVRVLSRDADSCTVEVTYYPLNHPPVGENPHWRQDDAGMVEYLRPTPSENWDETMRRDLLAELHEAGIEPDRLTDRQLVEQVSKWAMHRAHSTNAFAVWAVYFPDGRPAVYPPLRDAFNREKSRTARSEEEAIGDEVLGRAMFYRKVHGSCTSSSVYLTTIFRALGIPTRIVFCIPPFDPNDPAQAAMFYAAIHHHAARETVRAALDGVKGFDNHLFNEVYLDHHWTRLNYSTLGQPILDDHYFGLLTHIYTASDLSQVPLAQTWGMRYFKYPAGQPKLSSLNPYRLLAVRDHFGPAARIDNPVVPIAELQTVTIVGLLRPDSPAVPAWVKESWRPKPGRTEFLISSKEWVAGSYNQMRALQGRVGHDFLLIAPGHPDVRAQLDGTNLSEGHGQFQAYRARVLDQDEAKLVPGVAYTLKPINISDTYRWQIAPELRPTVLKD